ncbi:Torsin-1A-interacting protein 2, partial [Stylophora pistillata]
TDRFWKILRNRGLAHLRNKDPSQPLVLLVAAPPAAHEWVDCLATKLAEKLDPQHKTTLARIDAKEEKANPPEKTKKLMDNLLKEKCSAGHRVALVHHLELLPPPSPLLFYSYCHDQSAPYKHVAIIFTVHMPVEPSPSLSPKEAEESVEDYLSGEVWAKVDKDAVAGLLIFIADTVVLMNGEFSGSATDLCT